MAGVWLWCGGYVPYRDGVVLWGMWRTRARKAHASSGQRSSVDTYCNQCPLLSLNFTALHSQCHVSLLVAGLTRLTPWTNWSDWDW